MLTTGDYTADEIARKLGEHILNIRPRLSELLACEEVEKTHNRRLNSSGRTSRIWRLRNDS